MQNSTSAVRTPSPRLWPGVTAGIALLLLRFGVPLVAPGFEGFRVAFLGGLAAVLAILVWWLFSSRLPRLERWLTLPFAAATLSATWSLNHESMGFMWCIGYAVPLLCLVLVVWATVSRGRGIARRRIALGVSILLASGLWTFFRMEGLTGAHTAEFAWRWSETGEERLLRAEGGTAEDAGVSDSAFYSVTPHAGEWIGFRGPERDSRVAGIEIATDWTANPPVKLWEQVVGPGWSSFAAAGDLLYTQEQRGEMETVTAYRRSTGELVWKHEDDVRFFEAMGGVGPRATPAVTEEGLYALGATGLLNALDPTTGELLWSRNVGDDTGQRVPIWGFSGSPVVVNDHLVVAAGGQLAAYDRTDGALLWAGPDGGPSYSSPHLAQIDGVDQLLLLHDIGVTSLATEDGRELWQATWKGAAIVQPALVPPNGLLISAGEGKGIRRLDIAQSASGWHVAERWTSNRLKPNFNDFVVHDGHAYGFDGSILACIELDNGERRWKGGRYGNGQLLLLKEQNLLLVVGETGELALVRATPNGFDEVATAPGIEGKTWNHPALVGDLLLVRNAQGMAAFRLPQPTATVVAFSRTAVAIP